MLSIYDYVSNSLPFLFWCVSKIILLFCFIFQFASWDWSCYQVNIFREEQKDYRNQPCPHIVLTPTSVLPRSKAAVDLVQDCVMGGCKVMDSLQENWGVDHTHDSEKRKEDLCVRGTWVRLE